MNSLIATKDSNTTLNKSRPNLILRSKTEHLFPKTRPNKNDSFCLSATTTNTIRAQDDYTKRKLTFPTWRFCWTLRAIRIPRHFTPGSRRVWRPSASYLRGTISISNPLMWQNNSWWMKWLWLMMRNGKFVNGDFHDLETFTIWRLSQDLETFNLLLDLCHTLRASF